MHALKLTRAQLGYLSILALLLFFVSPAVMAQGGLTQVNTFLTTVVTMLKGAGVLIVTVAIMWCGYKMIFKGASFSEVAMIFVGGLLIGGASFIASYLVPTT